MPCVFTVHVTFMNFDKHSPDLGRDTCLAPERFKRSICVPRLKKVVHHCSKMFRSSRKCPEEVHQPLMCKQFGTIGASIFATRIYVKAYWFHCPSGTGPPRNDLDLLHELFLYPDKDVAKAATTAAAVD